MIGLASAYFGLLLSYYVNVASGPTIILVAGALYLASLLLGPRGFIAVRSISPRHRVG